MPYQQEEHQAYTEIKAHLTTKVTEQIYKMDKSDNLFFKKLSFPFSKKLVKIAYHKIVTLFSECFTRHCL